MINARLVSVLAIVCSMSAFGSVSAASIRNAYFSNGELVRGQYYKSEGQLPGATKEFTKGTDKVARLFVIFGDQQAHKVGGALKAADGRVVSKLDRQWTAYAGPINVSWRVLTHGFNLEKLEPGVYQLDLVVDDNPEGTYTFSLR